MDLYLHVMTKFVYVSKGLNGRLRKINKINKYKVFR